MSQNGRGRPRKPGSIIYLGRLRITPGLDPPELVEFAELWQQAEPERKQQLLRSALIGGLSQARVMAAQVEDRETSDILNDLLAEF